MSGSWWTSWLARVSGPRLLAFAVLSLGLLSSQFTTSGTVAYFTSTSGGTNNSVFQSGSLNITTGSLPSSTLFKWDTTGAGTECSVISGATTDTSSNNLLLQRMAPNTECYQLVTVTNSGNITSNVRLRLVRSTASGTAANDTMNQLFTLSLAQMTTGTPSNCTATFNYGGTSGWTVLDNAKAIGTAGGLGITGGGVTPVGFDAFTGGAMVDLYGNDATTNSIPGTGAQLAGSGSQNFCLQIQFPSAGIPSGNATGDNAAQTGTNTYYFVADAVQAVGR